jgi:hypothetical protein
MCRTYFTLLLGITLLGLVGCKRSTTVTGPNGEKITVTSDGSNAEMTMTGPDGEKTHITSATGGKNGEVTITGTGMNNGKMQFSSSEKGVALPEDFPKDAPIYTGGVIIQNVSMPDGMMVMIKTNDSEEKIKDFYEKTLKEQGWESKAIMKMPQGTSMVNEKDGRTLSVTIATGDETMIHLTVTLEKK